MRADVIEVLAVVDAHDCGGRAERQTENGDGNCLWWTTAEDAANDLLRVAHFQSIGVSALLQIVLQHPAAARVPR